MTIKGWVQVVGDTVFFPENIFGTKLPADFAQKRSLLTWEAKRNGATVCRATLTVEEPRGKR